MEQPSSEQSHAPLVAPVFPLLLCVLATGWYYSQIDALAGGRPPAGACVLEHPTAALEASCDNFRLAAAGTAGSLVLAFVTLFCFTLSGVVQKLTEKGAIPLTSGAKVGYWLALAPSFSGILLYPAAILIGAGLPLMHMVAGTHPRLDLLLVGLAVCGSCYWILKVFEAHPPAYDILTLPLSGNMEPADAQPGVHTILQRICTATQLPMPDQVIFGIEPDVDCTRRPVSLESKSVRGLTLYVSLPLCRLLSEDELAALITFHTARCELVPPELEAWIINTCTKWQVTRREKTALMFVPLWNWMERWDQYLSGTILQAMQRAGIVAGRSSTAAAIAIRALTMRRWAAFALQARTNVPVDGELVNLSERFALEMTERAEELAEAYLKVDENGVCSLSLLTQLVNADPADVRQRILSGPPDLALASLTGVEQMELELSRRRLRQAP